MSRPACTMARFVLLLIVAAAPLQSHRVMAQGPETARSAPTEQSRALTLTIGGVSRQLTPGDLTAMPQSRVTVHNGHSNRDETYTGVSLQDLLSAYGLPFSKETQRTYLRSYVRAQGTDFYFVIYSAAELSPDLNTANVIVATQVDGHDLGQEGLFKLVSTGDKRPARWVRNLLSLTLITLN